MYLASMVLKHYENQGRRTEDLPIVEWACRHLLYRAQEQLHDFLRNFPIRPLAGLLRFCIFPRGLQYSAPDDRLGHRLAELVLAPTEVRERLCTPVYRRVESGSALGRLQEVLEMSERAEELEKRIRVEGIKTGRIHALDLPRQIVEARDIQLLTPAEADWLLEYDRKVMDIINVDDFAPHELGTNARPRTPAVQSEREQAELFA
jgi:acyl-CoA dehydrogenase